MKMKMRKICSLIIALVLIGTIIPSASAASLPTPQEKTMTLFDSETTFSFDLSQNCKQEETIILPNGEVGYLGIEPVSVETRASYPNASGQWHIYWYTGVINIGYYIDISNSKITNAYGQHHLTFVAVVTGNGLSHTSTQATGWWNYEVNVAGLASSANAYLYATMNGSTLETTVVM